MTGASIDLRSPYGLRRPSALLEWYEYETPYHEVFDLRDDAARWLTSAAGEGMPPIDYLTERGPFQHGESMVGFRLRPRVLQLAYRQDHCSRQAYWDGRGGATMTYEPTPGTTARRPIAGLLDLLRPNRAGIYTPEPGILRKHLPDGSLRELLCYVEAGPTLDAPASQDRWDEWAIVTVLRFVAHDPVWYDPAYGTFVLWAPADVGLCPPFCPPFMVGAFSDVGDLYYYGTWPEYPPQIHIAGPFTRAILTNLTTGDKLDLTYTLAVGEGVVYDLRYGYKTVTTTTGINVVGYLSDDSDLATWRLETHHLALNGLNRIAIDCQGAGPETGLMIYYNVRYIGI